MSEKQSLNGVTVAIPETRQREILQAMLEARGATALPVPLVAIHDHPVEGPILDWLRSFIASPPELLILLTGEGLRRLLALAGRHGLREDFVRALAGVRKLCRGPKPERELRELSLQAELRAAEPTTEGVIETLGELQLEGMRVAVQLYGEEPNLRLCDYLRGAGAELSIVAPYVYASKEEEGRVAELIRRLAAGEVDVLAFTSQSQFKRLQQVARSNGLVEALDQGLRRTVLAAVGPVVGDLLRDEGYEVAIMPQRVYFMKPLVAAIETHFRQ